MNRLQRAMSWSALRVPRASGDEPGAGLAGTLFNLCSPRQRG